MLGSGQNTGTQKCKRHVPCSRELTACGSEVGNRGCRGDWYQCGSAGPQSSKVSLLPAPPDKQGTHGTLYCTCLSYPVPPPRMHL